MVSYNEEVRVVSDGITRTERVIATRLTEKERKERSNAPVWVYMLFRLLLPIIRLFAHRKVADALMERVD